MCSVRDILLSCGGGTIPKNKNDSNIRKRLFADHDLDFRKMAIEKEITFISISAKGFK